MKKIPTYRGRLLVILVAGAVTAAGLGACGNKGPLYLPEQDRAKKLSGVEGRQTSTRRASF